MNSDIGLRSRNKPNVCPTFQDEVTAAATIEDNAVPTLDEPPAPMELDTDALPHDVVGIAAPVPALAEDEEPSAVENWAMEQAPML